MDDKELRDTIAKLQAELERRSYEKRQNGAKTVLVPAAPHLPPAPEIPPAPEVPPAPSFIKEGRPRLAWRPCPLCRQPRPERGACPECDFRPTPDPEAAPVPGVLDAIRAWFSKVEAVAREQGFERFLGERLFSYVGMVLVVLGGAFFLKYAAEHSGPVGRVAIGAVSGLALAGLGELLRRRPRVKALSVPVTAGGWALITYTAYAAHAVPASRVVEQPAAALALLALPTAGMIAHALAARSRLLTGFAFAVSYFAYAATDFGPQTLGVCTVLALAGAWLSRRQDSPELVPVGLVGFAVNYWPTLARALDPLTASSANAVLDLGAAAGVYAVTAALAPEAKDERSRGWTDASLAFGAVLLGVAAHAQGGLLAPWSSAGAGLAVAGLFALLSGRSRQDSAASKVQALLAAAFGALAVWRLPGAPAQLWGFALLSLAMGLCGQTLKRVSFERYGLALAGLGGLTYFSHAPFAKDLLACAGPLASFGLAAYGLAARRGEHPGLWLYAGLGSLLAALGAALAPAPFAVAALCVALVLRGVWDCSGESELFRQAILVELFAGLYYLGIGFGADLPVVGSLTPRFLSGLGLALGYATLLASPAAPEGELLGVSYRRWRANVSWLALAVAGYGCLGAFDPRLRLPGCAMAALALLRLGRGRGDLGADLRAQAYLLAAGAPVLGGLDYLWGTTLPVTLKDAAVYGASSLVLLVPLAWRPWARDAAEAMEERSAGHVFAALSIALLALFVGKEASGPTMTLWWTALGGGSLMAGLLSGRRELRWPALALLGLCVAKAFLMDLTGLALPWRMLSMTGLGALLVASSLAYVRLVKDEPALMIVEGE